MPKPIETYKKLSENTEYMKGSEVLKRTWPPDATFEILPHDAVRMPWVVGKNNEFAIDWMNSMVTVRWNHTPETLERMRRRQELEHQ